MKKHLTIILTFIFMWVSAFSGYAGTVNFSDKNCPSGQSLVSGVITPSVNNILYVNKSVNGGNETGDSWENALPELADALIYAQLQNAITPYTSANPLKIFVAKGTYKPLYSPADNNFGNDAGRDNSFLMVNNVQLYGSFAGTEASLEERDLSAVGNESILNGDIDNNDVLASPAPISGNPYTEASIANNAYHVLVSIGPVDTAIIDGFIITEGNANGSAGGSLIINTIDRIYPINGGGIFNHTSSPNILNITITGNIAVSGGGMYNNNSSPILKKVILNGNSAGYGGGMNNGLSTPSLSNVTLSGNSASRDGGGIYNGYRGDPHLFNVIIRGNTAILGNGGGISNRSSSNPKLINVELSGNSAISGGGIYTYLMSDMRIINSTITRNEPNDIGAFGYITLINTIVWGNIVGNRFTATSSLIKGRDDITNGNIDATGLLDTDIFTNPANGDYSLLSTSTAVNVGRNGEYAYEVGSLEPGLDLADKPRIYNYANNGIIDLGAYEYQGDSTLPINPFITQWKTDNPGSSNTTSIIIPTSGNGYDYDVSWYNDGNWELGFTGDAAHDYGTAGTYTVAIRGDFPRIYFNDSGDKEKLLSIEKWGTNQWISMNSAFEGCLNLQGNASDVPDLSGVSDMSEMFRASGFNENIGDWDVSNVTNMSFMFSSSSFNRNISNWDVSNVTNMKGLFEDNILYNQYMGSWNVGNGIDMAYMFANATSFNQNISGWDVSNVTDMSSMFATSGSSQFNQNLSNWDVENVIEMTDMFEGVTLSIANYDALLIGWNTKALQNGVTFSGGNSIYCTGGDARANIISSFGWNITDGGKAGTECTPADYFKTRWKTNNPGNSNSTSITIPTTGNGYNYSVSWKNDGVWETGITGDATHDYGTAGTYTVVISGNFPRIYFNNSGDNEKIVSILQWGNNIWTSMNGAFAGCGNLVSNATDMPDLSLVTDMYGMFAYARKFNGDSAMGNWNVASVTNMYGMFAGASVFNAEIKGWNVGNVTTMEKMFYGATLFNRNLSDWNVSNVTNMKFMFATAMKFNGIITNWDVSNVTDMNSMFYHANSFDQNLGNWNVSNVTNMNNMFKNVILSTANYDSILMGWSTLPLKNNVRFNAGFSEYCAGEAARRYIVDSYNWNITDGGMECTEAFQKPDSGSQASLSGVILYPNPMKDRLNIGNPKNVQLEKIEIFDLTGRLLKSTSLEDMESKAEVDVSLLSSATYVVVVTGNNEKLTHFFIKE